MKGLGEGYRGGAPSASHWGARSVVHLYQNRGLNPVATVVAVLGANL